MFITIIFPPDASGLLMDQRLPAIAKVLPESPPEKAGRFPDDPFVAIEGKEVSKGRDRHHALEQKGWGNNITFTVTCGKKQKNNGRTPSFRKRTGCSKTPRRKAPASLSPADQAGNPESGVTTDKERLLATPACRNIPVYDGAKLSTQNIGPHADGDGDYGVQARRRVGESARGVPRGTRQSACPVL